MEQQELESTNKKIGFLFNSMSDIDGLIANINWASSQQPYPYLGVIVAKLTALKEEIKEHTIKNFSAEQLRMFHSVFEQKLQLVEEENRLLKSN